MKNNNTQGGLLIESMLSLFIISIITTSLFPLSIQLNHSLEEAYTTLEMKQILYSILKNDPNIDLDDYSIYESSSDICISNKGGLNEVCIQK